MTMFKEPLLMFKPCRRQYILRIHKRPSLDDAFNVHVGLLLVIAYISLISVEIS